MNLSDRIRIETLAQRPTFSGAAPDAKPGLKRPPAPPQGPRETAAAAYAEELYDRICEAITAAVVNEHRTRVEGMEPLKAILPVPGGDVRSGLRLYCLEYQPSLLGSRCRLDVFDRPLWQLVETQLQDRCRADRIVLEPLRLWETWPRKGQRESAFHDPAVPFRLRCAESVTQLVLPWRYDHVPGKNA